MVAVGGIKDGDGVTCDKWSRGSGRISAVGKGEHAEKINPRENKIKIESREFPGCIEKSYIGLLNQTDCMGMVQSGQAWS
jgi:hypothetical protein